MCRPHNQKKIYTIPTRWTSPLLRGNTILRRLFHDQMMGSSYDLFDKDKGDTNAIESILFAVASEVTACPWGFRANHPHPACEMKYSSN